MDYKLVSFDLDGTLLNSHHTLSQRSEEMLCKLFRKGVHVVFASGRPYTVLRRMVRGLRLFSGQDAVPLSTSNTTRCYCAGSNGSVVYDEDSKCLSQRFLHPKLCEELYKIRVSDTGINTNVFLTVTPEDRAAPGYVNLSDREGDLALDEWVCRYPDEKEAAVQRGTHFLQQVTPDLELTLRTSGVSEIFYLCYEPEKRASLMTELQSTIGRVESELGVRDSVKLSPSAIQCIDIVRADATKADAVQLIANKLGIPLSQCVAFGDGMNDAEMLRVVGKGYVMGNANPALKAALPDNEVIGSNDDDAVAATVEKLFDLP